MIKKTLFIAGGLLLLLTLLFGRNAFSYVNTMIGQVQETMDDSFSIDFHLKRARDQIAKLTPEIRKNKSKVAKEEVAVERLAKKVHNLRTALVKDEQELLRLKDDLETGQSSYVYVGTSYSAKEVEAELERRFEEFKADQATVSTLEKVLMAREQGLKAAREKLAAMEDAQHQLELKVTGLQARLEMVKVAQTSNDTVTFDDNRLTETRDMIDELEGRIRAAEKMSNVDSKLSHRIPLDEAEVSTGDITVKIDEFFSNGTKRIEVAESVE